VWGYVIALPEKEAWKIRANSSLRVARRRAFPAFCRVLTSFLQSPSQTRDRIHTNPASGGFFFSCTPWKLRAARRSGMSSGEAHCSAARRNRAFSCLARPYQPENGRCSGSVFRRAGPGYALHDNPTKSALQRWRHFFCNTFCRQIKERLMEEDPASNKPPQARRRQTSTTAS
jgi:hypothetical protein